jgi:hypothetical protein
MATVNYSWNLPTVGGSEDTWGTSLNANWTDLDTLLGGVSQTEFAILDGATVTTAELNILDGATVTTAEINQLDADNTGALKVPTGTVAERPTPAQGQIRFNSDDTTFEGYDGTAWGEIGGSVDFSAVAEDIIPDADSTRDIGSTSTRWAQGWFDDVTSTNTSDGTLSIPTTYVTNGSAKAWVNFNGTGTIAARDSFNLSSLTDNGTGYYTVTMTSAMDDANYAQSTAVSAAHGSDAVFIQINTNNTSVNEVAPTTTAFTLLIYGRTSAYRDPKYLCAHIQGGLA